MAPCYGWRSPHTRGARGQALRRLGPRRIIPAYAGSTESGPTLVFAARDHPRIRGEHLNNGAAHRVAQGSSPHTRGARPARAQPVGGVGIIPAYAGNTPPPECRRGRRSGSSPHTRGAQYRQAVLNLLAGIIPAYAGSTRSYPELPVRCRDHPRIRGEHHRLGCAGDFGRGSSPHTRGAPARNRPDPTGCGIIPAYAGSTGFRGCRPTRARDHPRIRGEHAEGGMGKLRQSGSSPHTRGARLPGWRRAPARWIIPAYAGSTCRLSRLDALVSDHPRIRGEHDHAGVQREKRGGSSPHTRGAHGELHDEAGLARIIPAYAGSTMCFGCGGIRMWDHPRIRGGHT